MTYCTYPGCMNNTLGQCQGVCLLRPVPPIANTAGSTPGDRGDDL